MASAGMVVVTNSFENKTAAAMREISGNLIVAEPSLPGVTAALREAVTAAGDPEARAREAAVRWPTDWRSSFTDEVVDRVIEFLKAS
jgi:hypothetical protein